MKRMIAFALAVMLAFGMTACGDNTSSGTQSASSASAPGASPLIPDGPAPEIDLQPSGLKQYQHSDRAQCSKAVTGQHNGLFVPTVAQSACENAHHNIGRIGTYGQKRCGECRALRLVRPDDEGEIRHCAAQCGKGLGQP